MNTEIELIDGLIVPVCIQIFDVKGVSVKGSYSYNAPSDLDYYGYTEIHSFDYCIWMNIEHAFVIPREHVKDLHELDSRIENYIYENLERYLQPKEDKREFLTGEE